MVTALGRDTVHRICSSQVVVDLPGVVKELVDDLAGAFRNGRTTPGTRQENEGWPFRDKTIQNKFPQLSEK